MLLAPLTDDYEYISEILDNINKAIEEQEKQEKRSRLFILLVSIYVRRNHN